jgi:hypothetical protein
MAFAGTNEPQGKAQLRDLAITRMILANSKYISPVELTGRRESKAGWRAALCAPNQWNRVTRWMYGDVLDLPLLAEISHCHINALNACYSSHHRPPTIPSRLEPPAISAISILRIVDHGRQSQETLCHRQFPHSECLFSST